MSTQQNFGRSGWGRDREASQQCEHMHVCDQKAPMGQAGKEKRCQQARSKGWERHHRW